MIENNYTELDITNWARRSTYEFFKEYEDPFFNLTAPVDVTALYRFAKNKSLSFSLAALYCSLIAANQIREFRIRISSGRLIEYEKIHATQTILNNDETFSFAYFGMKDDVFEFNRSGIKALVKYKALKSFDVESDRLDLIYFSVIPWVSFTSFKHASRVDRTQSVPRVVFGKIYDNGERKMMPLSVEVNHALIDGFHVGTFFDHLQAAMDTISGKR